MIRITVFQDHTERILGFEVLGHAGQNRHGQDIVCAGVSALTITACNGLEYFLGAKAIQVEAPEPGELRCFLHLDLDEEKTRVAQIILKTLLIGLRDMERGYGKFIKVDQRRCIPC